MDRSYRCLLSLLLCAATLPATAAGLSAAELVREVENCSLQLTGEMPPIEAEAQAMIVKVGQAVLAKGVTAHLFYFAPGRDGRKDDYGLILDAPLNEVQKALPRYAEGREVGGYWRDLEPIGDPDGSGNGQEKSLLVCRAGQA